MTKIKHIILTENTPDLREGRDKILKAGTRLTLTEDLAKQYIKEKVAKYDEPLVRVRKPIHSESELEDYLENKTQKEK